MSNKKKIIKFGKLDFFVKKVKKSKRSFIENVNRFIDWKPIEDLLNKTIKNKDNAIGNPMYYPVRMWKVLLLQRFFNLSDRAMNDALADRISFRIFTNFSFEYDTPDSSTICRFRNKLIKHKLDQKLFDIFNKQLEKKGLIVREGAIVDASIIEAHTNPKKLSKSNNKNLNKDTEAKFGFKNNKSFLGFKMHVCTTIKDNFILSGKITQGNRFDGKELIQPIKDANLKKKAPVYADRAYPSKENSKFLRDNNLKNKIMHKTYRNKKLGKIQKRENKKWSFFRMSIEKVFGTLKTKYGLRRTKYLVIVKNTALFLFSAICFNLKKAINIAY